MKIISGQQIDELCKKSIQDNLDNLFLVLSHYNGNEVFNLWRKLIRSIDEFIELPFVIADSQEEFDNILDINCDYQNKANVQMINDTCDKIQLKYGNEVLERFKWLLSMCFEMSKYSQFDQLLLLPRGKLDTMWKCHEYFNTRRFYYVTFLNLIPEICKGNLMVRYSFLISEFWELIEKNVVATTSAYFNLLLNNCLPSFTILLNGNLAKRNFKYNHLENIFLEPERLALFDQIKWKRETIGTYSFIEPNDKLYSYVDDIKNTLINFMNVYEVYGITENNCFKELSYFVEKIERFVIEDFDIVIDESSFIDLQNEFKTLKLYNPLNKCFDAVYSHSPFQKSKEGFFSSVTLLQRFIYRTLNEEFGKVKKLQVHSGFIFEKTVSEVLKSKGFLLSDIKRINYQEFDLITTKDGVIFNFQCKNNFINIFSVVSDYKKIARRNKVLTKSYERALLKEEGREKLIKDKLKLEDIKHFVISRFPVITDNNQILNFNELENWDNF